MLNTYKCSLKCFIFKIKKHICIHISVFPVFFKKIKDFCTKILTLRKKSVKLYTPENILEEFYTSVQNNSFKKLHIPHSSVFYIRALIEKDTGVRYTLAHVEKAMKEEGWTE